MNPPADSPLETRLKRAEADLAAYRLEYRRKFGAHWAARVHQATIVRDRLRAQARKVGLLPRGRKTATLTPKT